jgi:hypothetical protein
MFSYSLGANPTIDYPRLLVGDTQNAGHIFEDEEITAAYSIQASIFQSSMQYSGAAGATLPASGVSYFRVAAILLKALASSKARLLVSKLLDANITPDRAAKALMDQANDWLAMDDNSGAFTIIEQCSTGWGFIERFFKQVQRQSA